MKVTLIGHATMLVELHGCTVLTDPVFQDPFEDGAVVACPARQVLPERMPPVDKVVISHAHLDHFDIPSIDKLSRDVEVFCPDDPIIPYVLSKLGFDRVRVLDAGTVISLGDDASMMTTYSNIDVIEFGMVFKDSSGTFWNEVDTVVTASTAEFVRMGMGQVDLLFSVFASQNLGFFESMRAGYPLDIPRANIENVLRVKPKLVVPGSAGFRFSGRLAWTNRFVFPISRTRFVDDLQRVAPSIPSAIGNPGDVFEIDGGEVRCIRQASPFAQMTTDDTDLIEFDATAEVPPLVDDNHLGYAEGLISVEVERCFQEFSRFLQSPGSAHEPLFQALRQRQHVFALGVLFPDGSQRWLQAEFSGGGVALQQSDKALGGPTVTHRITASMLVARLRYEKSYVYYRGFSRIVETEAGTSDSGNMVRVNQPLPELLGYWLHARGPYPNYGNERRLDYQLEVYLRRKAEGRDTAGG